MKFVHRLGYYLGGFSIGLIFLVFFLSGKKTSCAYGPEARVLKNINLKPLIISDSNRTILLNEGIDSMLLSQSLKTGDVIFNESNVSLDSCKHYCISNEIAEKEYYFYVENCDSLVNFLRFQKIISQTD